jgi:glyoxylase-like metal-dependent hydrolase (beta-lactamase superfamily II)/8-oxo-dGTP pyrophosphatase MutT (NUDIX family)
VSQITQAASVLLARGAHSTEVLVVHRSEELRFFGGYTAFPGGKVGAGDDAVAVWSDGRPIPDPPRVAAVRELFEETGVLLARRPSGAFPFFTEHLPQDRRDLLTGRLSFERLLARDELRIEARDLVFAGSLVTPPFSPVRFDTSFYVARLPEGQTADVWPGELSGGDWITPAVLLDEWARGHLLITPPTLTLLEVLRDRSVLELPGLLGPLVKRLADGALPPITFAPGVHMLPLRTVALPPTTYTNAFLVGTEQRWLFDPGPDDSDEQEQMLDALDDLLRGATLAGVVLTHHHPDHVGGVKAIVERHRVPVWAHPITAELLKGEIRVDHLLEEGGRLDLGAAPDGHSPWYLEALHTPGHAAGHLAFYDPHYRLLLAGDIVSPLSSMVIAPPDGDLIAYLATLRRVRGLDVRMLLPAHGGPSVRPTKLLDEALAHRARREEQLLAALAEGPASGAELVERLYAGLPDALVVLARLQMRAALEKLRREGRAVAAGDDDAAAWSLVEPTTVA